MKKVIAVFVLFLILSIFVFDASAKTRIYLRSVLTGGTTGALDTLDGDLPSPTKHSDPLNDGDKAIVITLQNDSNNPQITANYVLDADSGLAETPESPGVVPTVISPDTNAGDKRWLLTGFASGALQIIDSSDTAFVVKESGGDGYPRIEVDTTAAAFDGVVNSIVTSGQQQYWNFWADRYINNAATTSGFACFKSRDPVPGSSTILQVNDEVCGFYGYGDDGAGNRDFLGRFIYHVDSITGSTLGGRVTINTDRDDGNGNTAFSITKDANILFNAPLTTTDAGTNAVGVFVLIDPDDGNFDTTAPISSPADMVQTWPDDYSGADTMRWYFMSEESTDKVIIGNGEVVLSGVDDINIGGSVSVDGSQTANTTSGFETLKSYTFPANLFNVNNKGFRYIAWGHIIGSAANQNRGIRCRFGNPQNNLTADTQALGAGIEYDWKHEGTFIRKTATSFSAETQMKMWDGSKNIVAASHRGVFSNLAANVDTAGTLIIDCQGNSANGGAGEITQEGFVVEFIN